MRSWEGARSSDIPGDSWREEPIMWRFRKKKKKKELPAGLIANLSSPLSLSSTLTLRAIQGNRLLNYL